MASLTVISSLILFFHVVVAFRTSVRSDFKSSTSIESGGGVTNDRPQIQKPQHWESEAKIFIKEKLSLPRIETRAKNLILMIGDGMGVSTVTASRIYKGQLEGLLGEDGKLYMETFPYVGTAKTYCSDHQVADSACSSTAYSCGVKTNMKTLGVTSNVPYRNCSESMKLQNHVTSVLQWAQNRGMSTGIVTTTSVTDASPAGSYAHIADRDLENDARVKDAGHDTKTCLDIAKQLVDEIPGKRINVILGGGRAHLLPKEVRDPENSNKTGFRQDGRNLIEEWFRDKTNAKSITSRTELLELDPGKTDFLLGLFSYGDLEYTDKRRQADGPTLPEMTGVAIKILNRNPRGFYLFVEGGLIDTAHHANQAQRALVETLEFDDAIRTADELTNDDETLIVVSADHSHLLTIAGKSPRGNSILGFTNETDSGDGLVATTLTYVNGPGYRRPLPENLCARPNISNDDVKNIEYRQMTMYKRKSATHAGEDVIVFAKGPFSHLFTGVNDQTFIAHAMRYAGEPTNSSGCKRLTMSIVVVMALINFGV